MIAAVSTVHDEAGIIAATTTHLLNAGVDLIIISDGHSTDGTREILAGLPITVVDQDGPLHQDTEMTRLARLAADKGATWVVPFDADEFWFGCDQLNTVAGNVTKVFATMYQHRDRNFRYTLPKPLPKVAFRPTPEMQIHWGNHYVDGIPGEIALGLQIREVQYRSLTHFLQKIENAARLYAESDFPVVYGSHLRELVAMGHAERVAAWGRLAAQPVLYDPILYKGVPWI